MAEQKLKPKLKLGTVVPTFVLPSSLDRPIHLSSYKQKRNVVMLFGHSLNDSAVQGRIREFVDSYDQYREEDCEVLVVTRDDPRKLSEMADNNGYPFPLLSDVDGSVTNKYTYLDEQGFTMPSLFVTDRYLSLFFQAIVSEVRDLPDQALIFQTVEYIQAQCQECGIGFDIGVHGGTA